MRTTITLDSDVAERLAALQRERGLSFKEAVNETLRRGFSSARGGAPAGRYRMPARDLGIRADIDIDQIRQEIATDDDARFLGADA